MTHTASVHLGFAPQPAKLRDALSAVVQIGDTLWVANDETTSLERLHCQGRMGKATRFTANIPVCLAGLPALAAATQAG